MIKPWYVMVTSDRPNEMNTFEEYLFTGVSILCTYIQNILAPFLPST